MGCTLCGTPIYFGSGEFRNPVIAGTFSLEVLEITVLLGCIFMLFHHQRKNSSKNVSEKTPTGLLKAAIVCLLIYDLLTMVDIIIEEKTESVDIAYFLIITIFETLLWRIAEVLTLAFIFRLLKTLRSHLAVTSLDSDGDAVITQDLGVSKHPRKPSKYDIITNVFIAILSIMSLAAVTMTAVYVGLLLSQGFRNNGGKYANASRYITIAYYVLYLFGSLYILGLSILYSLKARSKAATYLVSLVAPFLILGEALPLASALWLALHNSLSNDQLRLAANIIDTISQIIMYIGLTLMVSTKNPNFA